jgi:hypothetical protein
MTLMVPEHLRRTVWRPRIRASLSADLPGEQVHAVLRFDADGMLVELREILEMIAARRRWIVLRDGTISELTDVVADLADDVCDVLPVSGEAVVEPFHLGRLDRWVEVADEARLGDGVNALRARLRVMAVDEEPQMPRRLRITNASLCESRSGPSRTAASRS